MTSQSKIAPGVGPIIGKVELKKIGNSTGLIFPKELMARLNLSVGDSLYATLTPDGGIRFTPHDPKFEKAMEVARRGMKVYRNALGELAK
jgi:putative addiction module antidote